MSKDTDSRLLSRNQLSKISSGSSMKVGGWGRDAIADLLAHIKAVEEQRDAAERRAVHLRNVINDLTNLPVEGVWAELRDASDDMAKHEYITGPEHEQVLMRLLDEAREQIVANRNLVEAFVEGIRGAHDETAADLEAVKAERDASEGALREAHEALSKIAFEGPVGLAQWRPWATGIASAVVFKPLTPASAPSGEERVTLWKSYTLGTGWFALETVSEPAAKFVRESGEYVSSEFAPVPAPSEPEGERYCLSIQPAVPQFVCTLKHGHEGEHAAFGPLGNEYARWPAAPAFVSEEHPAGEKSKVDRTAIIKQSTNPAMAIHHAINTAQKERGPKYHSTHMTARVIGLLEEGGWQLVRNESTNPAPAPEHQKYRRQNWGGVRVSGNLLRDVYVEDKPEGIRVQFAHAVRTTQIMIERS